MGRKERWKRREDREETERKEKGSEERDKKEDRERERERGGGGGGGGKRKQRDITEGTGTKYRNGMGSDEIRLDMIGGLDKIGGNEMG